MEKVKAAKTVKKNVQCIKKQETLPFLHTNKISKQKVSIYFICMIYSCNDLHLLFDFT